MQLSGIVKVSAGGPFLQSSDYLTCLLHGPVCLLPWRLLPANWSSKVNPVIENVSSVDMEAHVEGCKTQVDGSSAPLPTLPSSKPAAHSLAYALPGGCVTSQRNLQFQAGTHGFHPHNKPWMCSS